MLRDWLKMYIGLAELWATEGLEHALDNIDWNEYEK